MPELRDPRRRPDASRGHPRRRQRQHPPEESPLIPAQARTSSVLVLGIGNPGRRDDGLGAEAVARLEALRIPGVTADADYQLNLEDALACARHDLVIFVDAARGLRRPFTFEELRPEGTVPAMTHTLGPGAVLALAETLYGRAPTAYMLAIRGHAWTLGEKLSARAKADLGKAFAFLVEFLRERTA